MPIRRLLALLHLTAALVVLAGFAIPVQALPLGVRIVDPEAVLADHSRLDASGNLYLRDARGDLRPFITSTLDPAIPNSGDGAFHTASPEWVVRALEQIDPRFVANLTFDVFILPYPVADPLGSWATDHAIYLSPGVREQTEEQVHYVLSHEVGHLVHRAFLPDSDLEGWDLYAALRGISDSTLYSEDAAHRNRPHEIFAEDFRLLFGSAAGVEYAAAENADLADSRTVPGLREFFLQRSGIVEHDQAIATCGPNPFRAGRDLTIRMDAVGAAEVGLYDVAGRRVRLFSGVHLSGGGVARFEWDGADDGGSPLAAGTYYLRIRTRLAESTVSILLLR